MTIIIVIIITFIITAGHPAASVGVSMAGQPSFLLPHIFF